MRTSIITKGIENYKDDHDDDDANDDDDEVCHITSNICQFSNLVPCFLSVKKLSLSVSLNCT